MAVCFECFENTTICNCSFASAMAEDVRSMLNSNLIELKDFIDFLNTISEKKYSLEENFVRTIYKFSNDKNRRNYTKIELIKECKNWLENKDSTTKYDTNECDTSSSCSQTDNGLLNNWFDKDFSFFKTEKEQIGFLKIREIFKSKLEGNAIMFAKKLAEEEFQKS